MEFEPSDIIEKIKEFDSPRIAVHTLTTHLTNIYSGTHRLYNDSDKESSFFPDLQEFIFNLEFIIQDLQENLDSIRDRFRNEGFPNEDDELNAKKYYENLIKLIKAWQTFDYNELRDELTDSQKSAISDIEIGIIDSVQAANGFFSQNLDGVYRLATQIRLSEDNYGHSFNPKGIYIEPQSSDEIETKDDFFKNAILPLLYNARDHAYIGNSMKGTSGVNVLSLPIIIQGKSNPNSGNYEVFVEDLGRGIPNEHLPKIFDVSFTTKKDDGIDHGIGLAGVKEFVEEYGGTIMVCSEVGKGTTFRFTIPCEEISKGIYKQTHSQE